MRRRQVVHAALAASATAVIGLGMAPGVLANPPQHGRHGPILGRYKHLVVIYEENHSFDNLYGRWGTVDGQRVDGLRDADRSHTAQVTQDGKRYTCLPQNDVNLTSPSPLPTTCVDAANGVPASYFRNKPFTIDSYIPANASTCPAPGTAAANGVLANSAGSEPGGCTRDLAHRFYQEQYQIDGGRQDRYVTGSDAVGLTMGVYNTRSLPIYKYLHGAEAPHYVVADHFFQAAFGGSFLNHQFLVAAQAPIDTSAGAGGPDANLHSVVDTNGFPTTYPLYKPTTTVVQDAQLTQACGPTANPTVACGDYAINTIQPTNTPHSSSTIRLPLIDDAKYPNIGDRLSAAGVSWNWYSGGWDDAEAGHAGPLFQYHHQPLNYFAAYAPGQPGRAHLQDETKFIAAATKGTLPTVSFVKPYGAENEHPGYASEPDGSDHLVDLLKTIENGPAGKDTLVIVTYDEFGGQWDHVSPPGKGSPTQGVYDQFGPGTRVPALVISSSLPHSGVDHTVYDTTSILATIERSLGLKPLTSRDAHVADLSGALRTAGAQPGRHGK
ncbi:alkaline phosphatase family protein [Frankia sp. CIT1]|uniref:alkaline phosphatase family protein n=1 Tax=Frankia sp. CIT1 TaxID=2880974 RepID=UPI001EF6D573|nr:alkaline phosphatase family protein [Frankia sp. CIT1]